MRHGQGCWRAVGFRAGLLTMGASMAVLGCHGKKQAPLSQEQRVDGVKTPAELAESAAAAIAAVCKRQSYATARVGLIAGETGLREDVFELRDPVSYKVTPYRLGATVRLEGLLRKGADAAGAPGEQVDCMREFADHFKTLSDPLVEVARDEKDVDVLAFKKAQKETQQEIDMPDQETKNPQ
jgi:hypothetical protein